MGVNLSSIDEITAGSSNATKSVVKIQMLNFHQIAHSSKRDPARVFL